MNSISHFILIIFFLLAQLPFVSAQYDELELTLTNQDDVDNFRINYPNCTNLRSLTIEGSSITNLNGLLGLKTIGLNSGNDVSELNIQETSIQNFKGLDSLISIDEIFRIHDNRLLLNFDGLGKIFDSNISDASSSISFSCTNNRRLKEIPNLFMNQMSISRIILIGLDSLEIIDFKNITSLDNLMILTNNSLKN
jgi:hypothetical protein